MKKCKKYNNIFEKLYNDSLGQWLWTYCFELKWWENFKLGLVEDCLIIKKDLRNVVVWEKSISIIVKDQV